MESVHSWSNVRRDRRPDVPPRGSLQLKVDTHGIPDPRDQYTKAVAEFAWMEHYVLGKDSKLKWADLLKTLDARTATQAVQP